ncbi:MAG: flagellar protein FliT [Azonexus sp.]|nr:flagellar protein FliT [Betaproteobacteria bacterium]MBK8917111.1 flagellar protein FliT [Betaproteobacteria bacterium]MBP6037443.1 flagellar protein FliT [Azonexus sp.]MBP6908021.1 flagellar protein FliT [Azonexus sp.]
MAAYLDSLRALAGHAERLLSLAQGGQWEALAEESSRHQLLFEAFAQTSPPALDAAERAEAKSLLAATLDRHAALSGHAGPWLADVGRLLETLSNPAAR